MKLAEALQERKDLLTKIETLEERISSVCLVQEGEKPIEDPKALLREYDSSIKAYSRLIHLINITNANTKVDGKTLTEIIARKDALQQELNGYNRFGETLGQINNRVRGSEIKLVPTLSAKEIRKKADSIAKEIRLLDNTLQMANWAYDLKAD